MSRTSTHPPTDSRMWRKLKARVHPDGGGNHELFVWAGSLEELVCHSDVQEPKPQPSPKRERSTANSERVPYPPYPDFAALTRRALNLAKEETPTYARLLRLLADCLPELRLWRQQERGASYKQLAYIAHLAGFSKERRITWYRLAEAVPLADRHAGHIIKRLKEMA